MRCCLKQNIPCNLKRPPALGAHKRHDLAIVPVFVIGDQKPLEFRDMVFGNDNQALALGNHTEARLLPSLNTCAFVQHRHSWMTEEEERAWYAAVRHIVCGILGTESNLIKPLDTKYGQLIIKINRFKEDLTMHRFHSALREVLAAVISVSLVMGMHASASATGRQCVHNRL